MLEISQHLLLSCDRLGMVSERGKDEDILQIWLSVKFIFPIYKHEFAKLLAATLAD